MRPRVNKSQASGVKIPKTVQWSTEQRILERLRKEPVHPCRLRYSGKEDRWSMAFYTYSNKKYEPCVFDTGDDHDTPEEAFETAAMYLQG